MWQDLQERTCLVLWRQQCIKCKLCYFPIAHYHQLSITHLDISICSCSDEGNFSLEHLKMISVVTARIGFHRTQPSLNFPKYIPTNIPNNWNIFLCKSWHIRIFIYQYSMSLRIFAPVKWANIWLTTWKFKIKLQSSLTFLYFSAWL